MGIAVILVVGSVGVWFALASRAGPGQASATIQSVITGAREYAVARRTSTRVVFENDLNQMNRGTAFYLEYDSDSSPGTYTWTRAEKRVVQHLTPQVFVLKDVASGLPAAPAVASENPTDAELSAWRTYQQQITKALANFAFTSVDANGYLGSGAQFSSVHQKFYIQFDPTGYLAANPDNAAMTVQSALVIIQVAGRRVGDYVFYPLNPNTGTRLVFE